MPITKTLITADELLLMPADGYRYELIEGELKQMFPGGYKHGAAIGKFTSYFGYYIEEHDLGIVCGAETGYKIKSNPDSVIAPDLSFIRKERVKEEDLIDGYSPVAPDLVVEVLSPGDTKVQNKVNMWLTFGVIVVITLDPRKRIVDVYRANSEVITLDEQSTLVLDDVVPGFSYPVAKLMLKKI